MSHLVTKPTNRLVGPAKTRISLGIRPVWSECSLCAEWVAKDPSFLHANSKDWADAKADLSLRWANMPFLYHATQKVAGYYVIPSELWVSVRPSVRTSVHLSVSASFLCSNFRTFWSIFFKLCIDIGIREEWYGIATGLISFWNNRVMALDVCQKCFALRFHALTLVPFYRFSSNFA